MNPLLLNKGVQGFISENYSKRLPSLILKGSPFPGIAPQELGVQLKGKKIAEKKFPLLFSTEGIIYPPSLNLEQASSERTARYKAGLVSGRVLIDLTGGFGVDSLCFSEAVDQVYYCELDRELVQIVQHNFRTLKADNITSIPGDGIQFLSSYSEEVDWIYLDPSRRTRTGGRVFRLSDCTPDVTANADLLWSKTSNILIKTSPLLDIRTGIDELKNVREVHILAIANEVKELLWVLERNFVGTSFIKTVNFEGDKHQFFEGAFGEEAEVELDHPQNFVYEPNAAIMKSGLFSKIRSEFGLAKLHQNTHLYTSNKLVRFPGRRFQIIKILPYRIKLLSKEFSNSKANISIRNFPDSVSKIRKKTGIKEGGNRHLLFCTTMDEAKVVLVCQRC